MKASKGYRRGTSEDEAKTQVTAKKYGERTKLQNQHAHDGRSTV
jgi:hypothetical protein